MTFLEFFHLRRNGIGSAKICRVRFFFRNWLIRKKKVFSVANSNCYGDVSGTGTSVVCLIVVSIWWFLRTDLFLFIFFVCSLVPTLSPIVTQLLRAGSVCACAVSRTGNERSARWYASLSVWDESSIRWTACPFTEQPKKKKKNNRTNRDNFFLARKTVLLCFDRVRSYFACDGFSSYSDQM